MIDSISPSNNTNMEQFVTGADQVADPIPHWEMPHEFFVDFAYKNLISVKGNIQTKVGPGVYFNQAYPWNWIMNYSGMSYIEVTPILTKKEAEKEWNLILSQLSSKPGQSPISIEVNGKVIVDRFYPAVDGWREDYFKVHLNEGFNRITIKLLNARTNYWIQKLYIDPVA